MWIRMIARQLINKQNYNIERNDLMKELILLFVGFLSLTARCRFIMYRVSLDNTTLKTRTVHLTDLKERMLKSI